MENQLLWNERYHIGVDQIDREHEKLFHILNKLYAFGRKKEKNRWVCRESVKYFKDHALWHFADEEEYMASIHYPDLSMHKRIHKNFRERVLPALELELEQSDYSECSVNHFLNVCAGWLVRHTLIEDHLIVNGDLIKHWAQLLPEEEQALMGQTIVGFLHSMFQLELRLISMCYSGERFGDGIYYRLIYSTKEEKKLEIFLVFEEEMIAGTIGSVLDRKAAAVGVMLMNVAGYMAGQIAGRIMSSLSDSEKYELKERQLLTYEQFQKIYEKQSPQYSMLFDAGKGYFAYCMTATDTICNEKGISLITENAVAEAAKYLNQNKEGKEDKEDNEEKTAKNSVNRKKKLLVVDDSDFMLKAMQSILSSDYEVITAKSGMSAIKDIAIARPDLILLDYEMPVCNGRQVLEMIRSEEEFTDLPVIFLTNKVDTESVRRAIALKPEGYLLKTQSTETVKKEIDHFFEKKSRVKK